MRTRRQLVAVVTLAAFMVALASASARTQEHVSHVSSAYTALAQEEESTATLKETMDWLGGKLPDFEFINYIWLDGEPAMINMSEQNMRTSDSSFEVNKCTLRVRSEWQQTNRAPDRSLVQEITIPFSDIDALSITTKAGNEVLMSTLSSKKTIRKLSGWYADGAPIAGAYQDSRSGSNLRVVLKNEENRNRLIRALKHAVKLCGGKVDPF